MIPLILALLTALPVQDGGLLTSNPLADLKDTVEDVLAGEGLAFSPAQESEIVLMMDERRRASEDLFGDLQDFTAGPTEGQRADQLRSAIDWMEGEFLARIGDYLTPPQREAWEGFVSSGGLAEDDPAGPVPDAQTQFVRIHNNAYTAEDETFRFGRQGNGQASRTEVIQRGGAGAFHGNAEFLVRDDALNARNPFARNKPDSQERQLTLDVSGPVIPGLLTTQASFFQNEAENVDTVRATTPTGVFDLGIVRPTTDRSYEIRNTVQLAERHSLDVDFEYWTGDGQNQGIGGFVLPERAYTTSVNGWEIDLDHFSLLGGGRLFETSLGIVDEDEATIPINDGTQINVLDAFGSGGAQNATEAGTRNYEFSGMYTTSGEGWTLKAGGHGLFRDRHRFDRTNFGGTFTFSTLVDFESGMPASYTERRGEPGIEVDQFESALFLQNDFQLTPQFALMAGVRYTAQSNLDDTNNLGPRLSFAWALGPDTVLRGGGGVFYQTFSAQIFEEQQLQDGVRQFEVTIEEPSHPDPFDAGTVVETFPSVRVSDPNLVAPYDAAFGLQIERTFFENMLVNVEFHTRQEIRRHRLRDLNAPLPDCVASIPDDIEDDFPLVQACRPDPARGVILNLEPTSREEENILRVNYRQRFSIFNVQARYTYNRSWADGFPSNNPSIPADNTNIRAEWSRAPFPPHQFETIVNAELPLGVFLTGRLQLRNGMSYSILTGTDDNRDGRFSDRPGGLARNTEPGPGFYSVDFNVSKAFFFAGGHNVNVFANMANAFNHVNPGNPSGVLTSPNFGRSTSAQNPREIELGVRYQF